MDIKFQQEKEEKKVSQAMELVVQQIGFLTREERIELVKKMIDDLCGVSMASVGGLASLLTTTGAPQSSTRADGYVKRDGTPIAQKEGGPKPIVRRHLTKENMEQEGYVLEQKERPSRNAITFEEMQAKARDIMERKADLKETIIFDCDEDLEGEAETESSNNLVEGFTDKMMKGMTPEELEARIRKEWQQNKVEEPPATDAPPDWLSRK